jgi:hypothetical protein
VEMTDLPGTPGDIYQFRIWLRGISPMMIPHPNELAPGL